MARGGVLLKSGNTNGGVWIGNLGYENGWEIQAKYYGNEELMEYVQWMKRRRKMEARRNKNQSGELLKTTNTRTVSLGMRRELYAIVDIKK